MADEKAQVDAMDSQTAGSEESKDKEDLLKVVQPFIDQGLEAVDVTPGKDGGVLKIIKKQGSGEDGPLTGDSVFVHYVGTLTDGSKFDSSRDRNEQFDFTLGKGQVIKAWDLGVASMKRGELCVLVCRGDYAYGENGSPPKIGPNATLMFEVELFDWKGEDLSESKDGSILRSTLEKGSGYESPNDGSTVEVHIVGSYNGTIFEDLDVTFFMGEASESGVVDGVETAVKKFKKGEKSRLVLTAKQAFGNEGNAEKNIPGGATVEYEVTLKQFEKAKESWELDPPEKVEQAEMSKAKGTNFFKAGKLKLAVRNYKRIIDLLENETELEDKDVQQKRDALVLAAHLNLAMCHLKLNNHLKVIQQCEKALALDPKSEKGLFRRGQARISLQDYDEGIADFKAVLEIDPSNKAAKNQIAIAQQKIKQQKEKDKKVYAGMFQKFAEQDAKRNAVEYERLNSDAVFKNIGDWSNELAKDMMPLSQEVEAFGEKMPEPKYDKEINKENMDD